MIKIYIKFIVNSEGESPKALVERLRIIGGVPMTGQYDAEVPLGDDERLFQKLESVHRALKGSNCFYTVSTGFESTGGIKSEPVESDAKTLEVRKKMYKAKLARWKEMGVDIKELETLLETDIEKFKEVSKSFLREHLDKSKVIEDVPRDLKNIDEEVFASIDDLGVTLESVCKLCKLSENEAILSLGRLISAGKVTWMTKDDREVYVRISTERQFKVDDLPIPADNKEEAIDRSLNAIRDKGSTVRQVTKDARLPEDQVMLALADLVQSGKLKSAKRGKTTVYYRA